MFVILGAVTLVAVLYGLIAAWRTRRGLVAMHMIALVLVIIAWSLGHMDLAGRIALVAAMLLEAIAWLGVRHDAPARSIVPGNRTPNHVPTYSAEPIYETEVPTTAEPIYDDSHPEPTESVGEPIASEPPMDDITPAPFADAAASGIEEAADIADEPPQPPYDDQQPAPETTGFPAPPQPASQPSLHHQDSPEICIRTFALLARPYHVTLSVLLASMKRAGLRQARLVEPAQETAPAYIEIDGLKIGLVVDDEPAPPRRIDAALSQCPLNEDVVDAVRAHEAHIAVDVAYNRQTARTDAVLTAMRAQAALMEFAPVVAVVWPDAANIVPAADTAANIGATAADAIEAASVCINERRFELDGDNAGLLVLDSIGLGAFGLPDAQVIVAEGDAQRGNNAVRELSRHFLTHGCDLPDGGRHTLADGGDWRVTYTRSAFDPDREVVQIRPEKTDPQNHDSQGAGST